MRLAPLVIATIALLGLTAIDYALRAESPPPAAPYAPPDVQRVRTIHKEAVIFDVWAKSALDDPSVNATAPNGIRVSLAFDRTVEQGQTVFFETVVDERER